MDEYAVRPIGRVESPLADRSAAPRQGDEGAPDAWLVLDPAVRPAMRDLAVGDEVIVLTWLDRADRNTLAVHPRDDPETPLTGVFSTRSPDRPNPIGLHRVQVLAIEGTRVRVRDLEALDGTPVVDIKPVLGPIKERVGSHPP
jgi:tRNA-Thr(GGU) m(6)t(6)A37 methyltransferase TsaA